MATNNMRILTNITLIISVACVYAAVARVLIKENAEKSDLETYIVHLKTPRDGDFSDPEKLIRWYESFLPKDSSRLVHTYRNVATGFAAKLSSKEVVEMEKMDGFITARPHKMFRPHTTHSPKFMGLNKRAGLWPESNYGEGVIIGVLDTGVAPGHPSFRDEGISPPPKKWKGKCEFNATMCNNKLIGARNFVKDLPGPPIDDEGHGTHTASTAAGNFVDNAGLYYTLAGGTAVGMAPRAHVAMYKVCSEQGCSDADILAAMDAAVEDGVDVLSLSMGGASADFFNDGIAIGAFGAIQKGIFVSCSAGNSGPVSASLSNEAPWILTVGASTTDRRQPTYVWIMRNAEYFEGQSANQFGSSPFNDYLSLVDAGSGGETEALCGPGSLDKINVTGKIVLCERGGGIARVAKGQTVKDAGGAGMILMNDEPNGYTTLADIHVLPASHVSYDAGQTIRTYVNTSINPVADFVYEGTSLSIGGGPDPTLASFSSRGPSLASPGILKPDIIGPGVNILAAWPVSVDNITDETATFNIVSGTSMSCPHLSGVAALLKAAHPDWSPAAIKSAIMTTASQFEQNGTPILDERNLPADILGIGAGHVVPSKANDPGLIYDLSPDDYVPYLCSLGYTNKEIEVIVGRDVDCSKTSSIPEAQLNYPSFSVQLGSDQEKFTRTVTNVGEAKLNYKAEIESIPGVNLAVTPGTLSFSEVNQKMTYEISFSRSLKPAKSTFVQGALVWRSNNHTVRSPISSFTVRIRAVLQYSLCYHHFSPAMGLQDLDFASKSLCI